MSEYYSSYSLYYGCFTIYALPDGYRTNYGASSSYYAGCVYYNGYGYSTGYGYVGGYGYGYVGGYPAGYGYDYDPGPAYSPISPYIGTYDASSVDGAGYAYGEYSSSGYASYACGGTYYGTTSGAAA